MGTGVYKNEVYIPEISADDWILDLGDVRESARVRINGQEAGTAWAVPFRLKVGKWLKPGKNIIEVEDSFLLVAIFYRISCPHDSLFRY